ncbi:MAG: hypothetical protein GXX95_07045 [Methanomassiliicoccus sp.]|nr:hypothetical protein [Methanomassiliicoccus sp.]
MKPTILMTFQGKASLNLTLALGASIAVGRGNGVSTSSGVAVLPSFIGGDGRVRIKRPYGLQEDQ